MSSLKDLSQTISKKFKNNKDLVFDKNQIVESVPSGDIMFNIVSGCGGFPKKRITEIFGMEGSGKTTLIYQTMAKLQREGKTSIFFDFESSMNPEYVYNNFGLDIDNETCIVFNPQNIEEGGEVFDILRKDLDECDFVAFDSISAMKPKGVIDASMADELRVGAHAKAIGRMVEKAKDFAMKFNCPVVFINQMRNTINTSRFEQNIGTGSGFNIMESYTTPGGLSPRFYSSLRMKIQYKSKIKDDVGMNLITGENEPSHIGNMVTIQNVKNKVGTPFKKGVSHFLFPEYNEKGGFSEELTLLDLLTKRGRITQRGIKFKYNGLNEDFDFSGAKKEAIRQFTSSPVLMEDARALVFDLIGKDSNVNINLSEEGSEEEVSLSAIVGEKSSKAKSKSKTKAKSKEKTKTIPEIVGKDDPDVEPRSSVIL